jgi:hypothetical protein
VHELDTALAEVREEAELLQLRLRVARAERDALRAADRRAAAAPAAPVLAACDPAPAHLAAQVTVALQHAHARSGNMQREADGSWSMSACGHLLWFEILERMRLCSR